MKKTLELINEMQAAGLIKDYAVGGAVGALRWVEPFFTRDLDVFVILAQEPKGKDLIVLTPLYEYLKKKGCLWEGQWLVVDGVPVDFFPADNLEKEAVADAEETEYEGVKTKVITPEFLIALFLRASRDKDIRKTEMLLEQAQINRKKLDRILKKYKLSGKFVRLRRKYL
ncbi:MAG: hypothetical protein ABIJ15_03870 [bacterium]